MTIRQVSAVLDCYLEGKLFTPEAAPHDSYDMKKVRTVCLYIHSFEHTHTHTHTHKHNFVEVAKVEYPGTPPGYYVPMLMQEAAGRPTFLQSVLGCLSYSLFFKSVLGRLSYNLFLTAL